MILVLNEGGINLCFTVNYANNKLYYLIKINDYKETTLPNGIQIGN